MSMDIASRKKDMGRGFPSELEWTSWYVGEKVPPIGHSWEGEEKTKWMDWATDEVQFVQANGDELTMLRIRFPDLPLLPSGTGGAKMVQRFPQPWANLILLNL